MRSIEAEGSTIDEAIDRALSTLKIGRDRVEIEIVSNATRGLFGLGGRKARIRATVRESVTSRFSDTTPQAPAPDVSRETESRVNIPLPGSAADRAREVLDELLRLVGVDCTVESREADEPGSVLLRVSGPGSGLVIGRRGQTLDAIEYFLNRAAAQTNMGLAHVALDVEGYRERRQESIEQLVARLSDKARKTGHVVTLNPMSPRDRRVVHLALRDVEGIVTRSQGEGHYRRVLIIPEGHTRGRVTRGE
jgi:spoIIIJ-associated protein